MIHVLTYKRRYVTSAHIIMEWPQTKGDHNRIKSVF